MAVNSEMELLILASFLRDPVMISRYSTTLTNRIFNEPISRLIYDAEVDYVKRYARLPSKDEMMAYVPDYAESKKIDDAMKQQAIDRLEKAYDVVYDPEFVKERFRPIAIRNALGSALIHGAEVLNRNTGELTDKEINDIERSVQKATSIDEVELHHIVFDEVAQDLKSYLDSCARYDPAAVVNTGIPELNESLMAGGWLPSELVCVSCPPGRGKSTMLVSMGSAALMQGKNVIHVFVGDNTSADGAIRYASSILGIDGLTVRIKSDQVAKTWDALKKARKVGQLVITDYPIGAPTIATIREFITRISVNMGFKPHMLIIDYLDNLKKPYGNNSYEQLGYLYEQAKALAEELQIVVLTASQPKISQWGSTRGNLGGLAGSSLKQAVVDALLTITRASDKDGEKMSLIHLDKLRRGIKFDSIPCIVDYSMQKIRTSPKITQSWSKSHVKEDADG